MKTRRDACNAICMGGTPVLQCRLMGKTSTDIAAANTAGIYCRSCSYDLRGQVEHRCPECGRGYDPTNRKTFRRRPRRRWIRRVILAAVLLLILLVAPFAWLYYDWHGEQGAVKHFRNRAATVQLKRIDVPVLSKLLPERYGWMLDRVEAIGDWSDAGSPDDLRLAASCRRLEGLHLYRSPVTRAGVEALANLRELYVLELSDSGIDDACAQRLGQMHSLEKLAITRSSLTDAGLAHLCRLPELKGLTISSPRLTSAGLNPLARLPKLEELYLTARALNDAGLTKLARLTRLKRLYVCDGRFTDAEVDRLRQALPNCPVSVLAAALLPASPATGPSTAP